MCVLCRGCYFPSRPKHAEEKVITSKSLYVASSWISPLFTISFTSDVGLLRKMVLVQ